MRFVEEEDGLEIKPVTPSVKLPPQMPGSNVNSLRVGLLDTLMQTISLNRQNEGMDTVWAHHPDFVESIEDFLDIWDLWLQLDIDMEPVQNIFKDAADEYKKAIFEREDNTTQSSERQDKMKTTVNGQDDANGQDDDNGQDDPADDPIEEERRQDNIDNKFIIRTFRDDFKKRYCNIYGSPNSGNQAKGETNNSILEDQNKILKELRKKVRSHRTSRFQALVKRGYLFEGFPVHFTDPDPGIVRLRMMRLDKFKKYLSDDNDDIQHTVVCKLYALPGRLLSCWVYIGIQKPISVGED